MNCITASGTIRHMMRLMLSLIAICVLAGTHVAMAQSGVTLTLVKSNNAPMPVPSGQVFTYTLAYSYSGAVGFPFSPGTLIIRDTLPSSLEVTSVTSGGSVSGNVVEFSLSGLMLAAGGGTVQINVRFWPGITCPQTVACNMAYLSVFGDTAKAASNSSCAMATAENKWLLIKQYRGGCLVDSGDVEYEIDVINLAGGDIGGLNLLNVSLLDVLPPGAIVTSVTPFDWTGCSPTTGTITFTGGPTNLIVEAGTRWYVAYIHVRYPGGIFMPGQTVTDTAKLRFQTPCSGSTYDTLYRTASNVLCGPVPRGTISKDLLLRTSFTSNPWYTPTWAPGCCGTYDIVYQNTSGITQSSVEINDTLPPTVDVSSMDVVIPGGMSVTIDIFYFDPMTGLCSTTPGASTTLFSTGTYTPPPGNICHIRWRYTGTFGPGASTACFVNVCMRNASYAPPYSTVLPGQSVINTACASGINVPPNLCAVRNDPVMNSVPNILAAKFFEGLAGPCVPAMGPGCSRSTAGPYFSGDVVRFRMVVANVGNVTAMPCTITDLLPHGFSYVGGETYFYGSLSGGAAAFNWPTCCMLTTGVPTALGGMLGTPSPGDTNLIWTFPKLPSTCGGDIDYLVIEFNARANNSPAVPPGNYFNTFRFSAGNLPMAVVSSAAEVTINGTAQVQCEKAVRPDIAGTSFSSSAGVQPGNQAEYRIRIKNTGTMTLANVYLLDIMPHIGDITVLPLPVYSARGSQFDMPLTSAMTGGVGVNFIDKYNNLGPVPTQNPSRTPLFCSSPPNPGGAVAGMFVPWPLTPPSTYSFQVQGVSGALGSIAPGTTQDFYFKATVPVGTTVGQHACNSFGLQVIPEGTTTCLTVESTPACVTAIEPDHNQCDSIWDEVKFDDCCGFSTSVLQKLGNITRLEYNVLPVGGGTTPSGVLQSITTSPCLPSMTIPATLAGTTSGALIYTPPCTNKLAVNVHATSTTASGYICIELIATLQPKVGPVIQCRDTICFRCDPAPKVRCDSMAVNAYPSGNYSMRTFKIFNLKSPSSPICSVKITVTPPPGGPGLYGDGLIIDGVPRMWTPASSMGFTRILPVHGLPASATVQFNLGVAYGIGWSGSVAVTIYHCDNDSCTTNYGPWDASKRDTISIVTPIPVPDSSTLHMHSLDFSTVAAAGLHVRSVAIFYDDPVTEIVAVTGATYPCTRAGNAATNCNDIFEAVHVKDRSLMIDLRRDLDDPANVSDPIATILYRADNDDNPTVELIYYDENGQEVGHSQATITGENPPNRIVSGLDGRDRIAAMMSALSAHPNPTSGRCDIGFTLPAASTVELQLLDMRGATIATVITGEHLAAGEHHRMIDMTTIPSGTYMVSLRVNGVPSVLRVELAK